MFFQKHFVVCAVIPVSCKSIQLIHDDEFEQAVFFAVLDHTQKFGTFVHRPRQGAVNIFADDFQIVALREGVTFAQPTFY